jgi:hypothetical protein
MAMAVVDALEPVQVDKQQRQRSAAARRSFRLAPQHLEQVPRVVQLRQIVRDGERFRALHPQRVLEGNGAGRNPGEQHVDRRGRQFRSGLRRHTIDRDDGADGAAAALERKCHRRRPRPVRDAPVVRDAGGTVNLAAAHDPGADRLGGAFERRREPVDRHRTGAPAAVNRQHEPAGRGDPVRDACDQRLGDPFRVEGGIHRTHHVG